jgi:hypothetical protein
VLQEKKKIKRKGGGGGKLLQRNSLSLFLVNFCTMAIKYFGKKNEKYFFCESFKIFQNFGNIWNHKIGDLKIKIKKTPTWCRVFEFKFEYECSRLDFKEASQVPSVRKGQLYTDFSAMPFLTFKLQTFSYFVNEIIYFLFYIFIYLYICTKCSITHDTMTSKPWVGSTGYYVKGHKEDLTHPESGVC